MRLRATVGAGLLFTVLALLAAGCGGDSAPLVPSKAASPQETTLDWDEQLPESGPALVFRVGRFAVTYDGWEADVAVENRTDIPWRLPGADNALPTSFGVMLFPTDDLDEVEARGRSGDLPGLRAADVYMPALPSRLAPGAAWRGTIAARGALAAGLYVRIVLGPFVAVGDTPDGMQATFSWITDHTYRLKG
jgi:hypothetical protein